MFKAKATSLDVKIRDNFKIFDFAFTTFSMTNNSTNEIKKILLIINPIFTPLSFVVAFLVIKFFSHTLLSLLQGIAYPLIGCSLICLIDNNNLDPYTKVRSTLNG